MDPAITITRVRESITATGLSQGEFAVKAGLDAAKMSKSLAGVRRFTSSDLANIADLAGVSVDYLLGGDAVRPLVAARALSVESPELEELNSCAVKYFHTRENLDFLGFSAPNPTELSLSSGSAIQQGESLAAAALAVFAETANDPTRPLEDLATAIEEQFHIDVAICQPKETCDGLTWRTSKYQIIVVAATSNPTRQRFTLAHELCHSLAGDGDGIHIDHNVNDPGNKSKPAEIRANAFAAALLMPAARLRETFGRGVPIDSTKFSNAVMDLGVSPSALSYRLQSVGLCNQEEAATLRTCTAARAAKQVGRDSEFAASMATSRSTRIPTRLMADSISAYLAGQTTLRPLANLLQVDVADLRAALRSEGSGTGAAGFEP